MLTPLIQVFDSGTNICKFNEVDRLIDRVPLISKMGTPKELHASDITIIAPKIHINQVNIVFGLVYQISEDSTVNSDSF